MSKRKKSGKAEPTKDGSSIPNWLVDLAGRFCEMEAKFEAEKLIPSAILRDAAEFLANLEHGLNADGLTSAQTEAATQGGKALSRRVGGALAIEWLKIVTASSVAIGDDVECLRIGLDNIATSAEAGRKIDPDDVQRVRVTIDRLTGEATLADLSKEPAASRKKKRGRDKPSAEQLKKDKKVYEAWNTRQYGTFAELGRELKMSTEEAKRAVDRQRKRIERRTK